MAEVDSDTENVQRYFASLRTLHPVLLRAARGLAEYIEAHCVPLVSPNSGSGRELAWISSAKGAVASLSAGLLSCLLNLRSLAMRGIIVDERVSSLLRLSTECSDEKKRGDGDFEQEENLWDALDRQSWKAKQSLLHGSRRVCVCVLCVPCMVARFRSSHIISHFHVRCMLHSRARPYVRARPTCFQRGM